MNVVAVGRARYGVGRIFFVGRWKKKLTRSKERRKDAGRRRRKGRKEETWYIE